MSKLRQAGLEAGFTNKQMDFMEEWLAPNGHQHTTDDIMGLDQVVEEMIETNVDSDDEDDEEG